MRRHPHYPVNTVARPVARLVLLRFAPTRGPSESERLRRVEAAEQAANILTIWEGTAPAQDNRNSYTGA